MEVASGFVVTLEYTVRLASGAVIDSTGDCGPISVLCGEGQLFVPLEERLAGMHAGETRTFRIPAEEAFAAWDPALVRTLPRDRLPSDLDLVPGEDYRVRAADGRSWRFRVVEVAATEVRADFNPPQAGQDLMATVTVLGVRPPTPEEARRGRV
jgi:FKBP-type peptidyl-prolyl cis-trans isomerase SlyD